MQTSLLSLLVAIWLGVGGGLCLYRSTAFNNPGLLRRVLNNDLAVPSTFINSESTVWHMEADLYLTGNILFSDGFSLKTTDGKLVTTIAGSATESGYQEGHGTQARFQWITGFTQLNATHVLVVDYNNHCLRVVSRIRSITSLLAGQCGKEGYADGSGENAMFDLPRGVIRNKQTKSKFIVTDQYNQAIRQVDVVTANVSTLYKSSSWFPLAVVNDMLFSNTIYITTYNALYKLSLSDNQVVTHIAGMSKRGYQDGELKQAMFYNPYDLLQLSNDIFILVDTKNDRLRLVNAEVNKVSTISYFNSTPSNDFNGPRSILYFNNTLYVGRSKLIAQIREYRVFRKLQFEAVYDVQCSKISSDVAMSMIMSQAMHNYAYVQEICGTDCGKPSSSEKPTLNCVNDTLTIRWPTDVQYSGDVTSIPNKLLHTLIPRLVYKGLMMNLFIIDNIPPVITPRRNPDGSYARVRLQSFCQNDMKYNEATDECQ